MGTKKQALERYLKQIEIPEEKQKRQMEFDRERGGHTTTPAKAFNPVLKRGIGQYLASTIDPNHGLGKK